MARAKNRILEAILKVRVKRVHQRTRVLIQEIVDSIVRIVSLKSSRMREDGGNTPKMGVKKARPLVRKLCFG